MSKNKTSMIQKFGIANIFIKTLNISWIYPDNLSTEKLRTIIIACNDLWFFI